MNPHELVERLREKLQEARHRHMESLLLQSDGNEFRETQGKVRGIDEARTVLDELVKALNSQR